MRKLTGRKFIGVGKFTLNGTYDRQITQELTEIIRAFEQITGHLPVNNTEPCPYFQKCGEYCFISKAVNCDEYARRERLRRYY